MTTARTAALTLLTAVLQKSRPLDEAWADELRGGTLQDLEPRDRAFTRALTATTLRRLGQLDATIDHLLDRPLPDKATRTRNILRLGLAQILFLKMAAHAAVNETVTLADAAPPSRKHKDLVNAILRKAARQGDRFATRGDVERLVTPAWLWDSWIAAYGEDTTRALIQQQLTDPLLDITVKDDPAKWTARLYGEILPTGTIRRASADVTALPGFDAGAWWVQDAAAALPAQLLGDVSGKSVIDLCAAPGGKTAQLCAAGAQVTAVDRSANRLKRVTENLDRLGLDATLVAADATAWRPDKPADAILLDAPCSATGTIRRHPDVAHLKLPDDLTALTRLQTRLLDAAADMLAPDGVMVYCTCSLQPEEGPAQIATFLERTPGWQIAPIAAEEIGGLGEAIQPDGSLRTLPSHWADRGGMDGFFAARLRRA